MTLTLINCIPSSCLQVISKISIVFTFSHVQAYVSETELALKFVKVILGPSFEQTMMSWSPRYCIKSFVKIGPPVLEKIFERFLP